MAEIAEFLLDSDGTTRDVTFTPVGAASLRAFLNSLLSKYHVIKASDAEGKDVESLFRADVGDDALGAPGGYVHAVLEGSEQLIPVLQLFIDWPVDEHAYSLELSFFPSDLDAQAFQVHAFVALIEEWRSILGADDYFVRYENASWDWYDAAGLGVIYTGHQLQASDSGEPRP
jgi:hypothetical protein